MSDLLALDVGNTSVAVGLFRGRRLLRRGRFPTARPHLLARAVGRLGSLDGVILSSVVPAVIPSLIGVARAAGWPTPWVVGKDLKAPVINRYRIPRQVGQDRLVNAAAAFHLYGGPAIIVDFGTAVTIDLVSARREYLGGLIVPGMEISLETLVDRTALLPEIRLDPPREFLGRDTRSSMRSGLFYGYGALCDGLVTQLKKKHAPRARVVATGGHARLIAPFCRTVQKVNSNLTLQGLELTYRSATEPSANGCCRFGGGRLAQKIG